MTYIHDVQMQKTFTKGFMANLETSAAHQYNLPQQDGLVQKGKDNSCKKRVVVIKVRRTILVMCKSFDMQEHGDRLHACCTW